MSDQLTDAPQRARVPMATAGGGVRDSLIDMKLLSHSSAALCLALLPLAAACWSSRRSSRTQLPSEPQPAPAPRSGACVQTSIDGLSLFEDVLDTASQQRLVAFTEAALTAGRAGKLPGRTFQTQSPKWAARGQSREMLQYGVYTNSNRVEQSVEVAPLPPPLLELRAELVARGIFDESNMPDCCCINIYSPGMWLPPHVDNLEFGRPFCTVSLLSDQPVVFGDGARPAPYPPPPPTTHTAASSIPEPLAAEVCFSQSHSLCLSVCPQRSRARTETGWAS